MNSYTLTSKQMKKWLTLFFILPLSYIIVILSFNFIIDPFGLTSYNLLNIEYKLTRNDRIDKIQGAKKLKTIDNLLIGTSRVYSINPRELNKYFKGKNSFNFGIGGSQPEDHLGILLYLKKINKLPQNLVLAVDFNSFNPNIPINKYFLKSKELNFMKESDIDEELYINKFLTIDATRASFKTLTNHLKDKKGKQRFNDVGLSFAADIKQDNKKDLVNDKEKVYSKFYKDGKYPSLDKKRLSYIKRIISLCNENNINLVIYSSPTYIKGLKDIKNHKILNKRYEEFISYFSKYNNFTNLLIDNEFNNKHKNFTDRVHTTTSAGNKILKLVLDK